MNNSDKKLAFFVLIIRPFYKILIKTKYTYFIEANSKCPWFESRQGLYFLDMKIPISDLILITIYSFDMAF